MGDVGRRAATAALSSSRGEKPPQTISHSEFERNYAQSAKILYAIIPFDSKGGSVSGKMSIDKKKGFIGSTFQNRTQNRKPEEGPRSSPRSATFFAFLIAILIMAVSFLSITVVTPVDDDSPASISFSKRGIISIISDAGFTNASGVIWGSGTVSDPFIIEGWDIDASPGHAISIWGTRAYFEVRGCYLHNGTGNSWDGIIMQNVENGTVWNNIIQNNSHGIHLDASNWNRLFHNNVSLNKWDGIYFDYCHNDTVDNNTCWNNLYNGIYLSISDNNTLSNNTCTYNNWSGISLEASSNNTINWNNCTINTDDGINMFWKCYMNLVHQNVVMNNTDYGCQISTACSGNQISDNTFIGNNGAGTVFSPLKVQGFDNNGPVNSWSIGGYGNYWNDWTTPDILPPGGDGIVDNPYPLDPSGLVVDPFPLTNWTVIPEPGIIFLALSMMAACLLIIGKKRRG
jgi:parallel beta-helix repeat protein